MAIYSNFIWYFLSWLEKQSGGAKVSWMNNLFHQSIYDVYSMVSIIKFNVKSYFRASLQLEKDDDFVKFINPCTRRETSALGDPNMRNLKQGEIIQLERKGYYRCDVPLFGRPNPLFFLQYQMADNSPQQTRSPVWFLEHMNYKIQFVRFLDIVGWITLLFKNLVMTKSWKSECEISVFQCRLLCFPLHAYLPTADSLNCCVDFMQSILVVTIMYDEVASYKISPYLSSTFDVKIHGTCWYRFSTNEYIFQLLNKVKKNIIFCISRSVPTGYYEH